MLSVRPSPGVRISRASPMARAVGSRRRRASAPPSPSGRPGAGDRRRARLRPAQGEPDFPAQAGFVARRHRLL